MASYYSDYGTLMRETMDTYAYSRRHSHSLPDRLNFYLCYLADVLPHGVGVIQIPQRWQAWNISVESRGRLEINLFYRNRVFMVCVISMEDHHPHVPEEIAGALANNYWNEGILVHDPDYAWHTFTATINLKFCSSRDGEDWNREATFHPIDRVQEVVRYFRQCFERVRRR